MKYTLLLTQCCNLACSYCYVPKRDNAMSRATALDAINFIFRHGQKSAHLEIGFFGGEPLLEFDLIRQLVADIEAHPDWRQERVGLTLVTNGTIFSDEIASFLTRHGVRFCVSCDGPPEVQDRFRRTRAGAASSRLVERTIRSALGSLPAVLVNSVYRPETLDALPETIEYLAGLGVRHLYQNADYSAPWRPEDVARLAEVYAAVAERYLAAYRAGAPLFVSLIDNKVAVLLRGGYHPLERCAMGRRELAFSPDRRIYPCERLVAEDTAGSHAIGDLDLGLDLSSLRCRRSPGEELNAECRVCGLRALCMNWCTCSNYFMTGKYDRVGAFLCASEKAAIAAAERVFRTLEAEQGPTFIQHWAGDPQHNSVWLRN